MMVFNIILLSRRLTRLLFEITKQGNTGHPKHIRLTTWESRLQQNRFLRILAWKLYTKTYRGIVILSHIVVFSPNIRLVIYNIFNPNICRRVRNARNAYYIRPSVLALETTSGLLNGFS
jgi:hypothetical protein